MSKISKYLKVIFLGFVLVFILAAFGCKQETDPQDTDTLSENINPTEQITYDQIKPISPQSEETVQSEEASPNNDAETNSTSENTNNSQSVSDDEKLLLEQAEKLAEIYGTYTNKDKNTYKNLKDLKQYSTTTLEKWFDEKSKIPINSNDPFYGVTTSALSSVFLEQSSLSNKILVTVKKEEITSTNNTPKVSYRVILMTFEKITEEWKLSGIYWQN